MLIDPSMTQCGVAARFGPINGAVDTETKIGYQPVQEDGDREEGKNDDDYSH